VSAPLTVAVIARDEEALLGGCLASLSWAAERLVVVDAATRDRTREVAVRWGARVEDRPFRDFASQRNAALELARSDWVLFVDADERVSPALRDEVLAAVGAPGDRVGFWIPRDNYMFGRVVRGGGWSPDFQLRLLKRHAARYDATQLVHEVAHLDGLDGHLTRPIEHRSHRSLWAFARAQDRYSALAARRWLVQHGRPRRRAVVGQPVREFWRRYVRLAGYRDGVVGLVLSLTCAWYAARTIRLASSLSQPPADAARPPS
jgi:glycosyltransferase involved in cell wall biosynthesis